MRSGIAVSESICRGERLGGRTPARRREHCPEELGIAVDTGLTDADDPDGNLLQTGE